MPIGTIYAHRNNLPIVMVHVGTVIDMVRWEADVPRLMNSSIHQKAPPKLPQLKAFDRRCHKKHHFLSCVEDLGGKGTLLV